MYAFPDFYLSHAAVGVDAWWRLLEFFSSDIVIAGDANRYALVHVCGDEFWLIAQKRPYLKSVQWMRQSEPGISPTELPLSLLHATRQTGESRIVRRHEPLQPPPSSDSYFSKFPSLTACCVPCHAHGELIALLYIESDSAPSFDEPDIRLLENLIRRACATPVNGSAVARHAEQAIPAIGSFESGERNLHALMNALPTAIYTCDIHGEIESFNQSAIELWGRTPMINDPSERFCGSYRLYSVSGHFISHSQCPMALVLRSGFAQLNWDIVVERPDGSRRTAMVNVIPRLNERGEMTGAINCMTDITDRVEAEARVRYLAQYDMLTGLPNRMTLQDRLKQAITNARRHHAQIGLLFIDLDNFKHINDSLGHHTGDRLLQMIALRLQQCVRDADSVGRLGGDEFVMILPLSHGAADALRVADKLRVALCEPFSVDGNELNASASIGISIYPNDGDTPEALMRAADTAMYHAKSSGRDQSQFYTAILHDAAKSRYSLEQSLRQAMINHELVVHYQPQVDMASGHIVGVEALLRWMKPDATLHSGGMFISIAEQAGLIHPLGEWVLREACTQLKIWHDAGYEQLAMSVNLSPRQFDQPDFCLLVQQILNETDIRRTALTLEITESLLIHQSAANCHALDQLHDLGVKLAIDDFGTGYSSLSYLKRFPIDVLKIDRSFITDVTHSTDAATLTIAIIAMARSLKLDIIAEGVETDAQSSFLLSHDCNRAQGYYYSEACSSDRVLDLVDAASISASDR